MRRIIIAAAAVAAVALPAAAASAAPAAAPGGTHTATTTLTNRPDGGHGGPWAYDDVTRTLTLKLTGITGSGSNETWHYDATVRDTGAFTVIKGALTPNQSGAYAGEKIRSDIPEMLTSLTGRAEYSFTASRPASNAPNAGVVRRESGAPAAGSPQTTSLWFEQAFPAGTTFGGPGIGAYLWTYGAVVFSPQFPYFSDQRWVETSANGDGNLPGDGNISG